MKNIAELQSNRAWCFFLLSFAVMIVSCTSKSLPADEYVRWLEKKENGLRVEKEMGKYKYIIQYKPVEYVLALEKKTNNITAEESKEK